MRQAGQRTRFPTTCPTESSSALTMTPVESSRGSSDRCDGPRSSGTCSSSASSPRASAPRTTSRRSSGCASKRTPGPFPVQVLHQRADRDPRFANTGAPSRTSAVRTITRCRARNQFLRSSPYFPGLPQFSPRSQANAHPVAAAPVLLACRSMSRPPRSWSKPVSRPSHPPSPRNRRGGAAGAVRRPCRRGNYPESRHAHPGPGADRAAPTC